MTLRVRQLQFEVLARHTEGAVTAAPPPAVSSNGDTDSPEASAPIADEHDEIAPGRARNFRVRPAQMSVLRYEVLRPTFRRMEAHLRAALGERLASISRKRIRAHCDRAVRRAAKFGITTEHGATVLAAAMMLYGGNFETLKEQAWAGEVLPDPAIPPGAKVKIVRLKLRGDFEIDMLEHRENPEPRKT